MYIYLKNAFMLRWLLFICFYTCIILYAFQALKTVTKNTWAYYIFFALAIIVAGNFILQFTIAAEGRVLNPAKSYAFGFLLTFVSLAILIPILLTEDVVRVAIGLYHKFSSKSQEFYMPERRKFISQIALGIAAIPFTSLLYGMFIGKYRYRVLNYTLHFEDLPEAFDGYRITQISDIHSGSFDDREKITYGVELINKQASDVILFTGDMVNNKASEMLEWKDLFSTLKAKDGVFSVLGNHDYGDYVSWPYKEDKARNLQELKDIQKEMGYNLLLNDSAFIEKDGQRIAIVGVENWGHGFKQAGDLQKASKAVTPNDFKILMSHDPTHWEKEVIKDKYHYHLTLSGHTHGMQFGIEIPGWIKWSPVKWRYKHWAGIYKEAGQYINVNRGFGFLGYPGRVGIWPEVTVIELKKGVSNT